ncbi:MAG: dehydrogenase, partial [Planctomycetota bacterium]
MCRSLSDPPVRRVAPSLPPLLLILVFSCAVVCSSAVTLAEDARAENAGAKDAIASPYASANRLAYLDEFCDPYYPSLDLPKLITPQWVGQEGVEAVITLGIDDMREAESYEAYLRPILDRLKKIDGRAPVSILTNKIDPAHPQLAKWLAEGLSLETHTADHPCPCLQGSDFAKAKSTYDRCVDQLAAINDSHPVAFRFPCCDSLNTPSPRAFAEILSRRTPQGNFCQIDTSVVSLLTAADDTLPRKLVTNDEGQPRFARYVPFKSFVNRVENYPYPFVIAGKLWEFPIAVPDDWQGQNLQAPRNPVTVDDTKVLIDATVLKRGVANLVFHPYNWLRNDQYVEIIDHAVEKYGDRVLFLNFRECLERLNRNLLAGQSLRAADGGDNGVRLLDVNNDGFMDVVIGNEQVRKTRIWQPQEETWREVAFPVQIVTVAANGTRRDAGVRFGILRPDGMASFLVAAGDQRGIWHFDGQQWQRDEAFGDGPRHEGQSLITSREGRDQGVRLRDVDGDGVCEILVAGPERRYTLQRDAASNTWRPHSAVLPEPLVDASGRDAGLRLVDLNADGFADAVFSNERRFTVHLFEPKRGGWTRRVRAGARGDEGALPMIVRNGTNNGAWFAKGHLWIQNEDTHKLPDGVDRRTFAQLLGTDTPAPKSPKDSLESIRVRADLRVELVAAEPLTRDPIAIDWGADGKLWVVEMADYPLGMDNQGQPGGRVRFLEDTDGDGRYDRSQLFLDELAYPTGVMAWRDGVLVSVAPHILFARDTTGDGEADQVEILYEGFGEENQQHRMNGFAWGLDNWLHLADGGSGGTVVSRKTGARVATRRRDMRIDPRSGAIDALAGHSQFGRRRDDWGNWFGCDNVTPLRHYLLTDRYLRRNVHAAPAGTHLNL